MLPMRAIGLLISMLIGSQGLAAAPTIQQAKEFNAGNHRVSAAPPAADIAHFFPHTWERYQANPEHNAAFSVPKDAPQWLRQGVDWRFAGHDALPLEGDAYQNNPVNTTQRLGFAVGVSVVDGMVFAGQGARRVYALDAQSGKEIWAFSTVNEVMNSPVVADGLVFAGAGDTGFSFDEVVKFKNGERIARGMGFGAYYALDKNTGRQVWRFDTEGNAMPGAVYLDHVLYFATGDGHVYAVEGRSGQLIWKTDIGGFVSMSSLNALGDVLYVGASNPNFVYALNRRNGKILWQQTIPGVANTGMGDNSPAVAAQRGLVIQSTVVDANVRDKTNDLAVFALDAKTGTVKWQRKLGRGHSPPAYKAGVAMVHDDTVYVGSPVTNKLYALSLDNGSIRWELPIPDAGKNGAGRGSPTYYDGKLYFTSVQSLYRIDPQTGRIEAQRKLGGRFGIVNPVIVGGTAYLSNSWGWIMAVPLASLS